jgi:RNA polymerase sigma-70 factor (ECF subfamily)
MDEREALARLKRGDIGGLEALVLRYQVQAVQAAYLVVSDYALAEDIAQAAFLRAFERIASFDASRPFGPWFMRIVVNRAISAAGGRHDLSFEARSEAEPDLPSTDPGLQEILEAAETREEILAAMEKLSPGQRAAIVMRYFLDMSDAEVSQQLAVPEGTVRRRLHDARHRLRRLLTV